MKRMFRDPKSGYPTKSRDYKSETIWKVLVLANERFSARAIGEVLGLHDRTVWYIVRKWGEFRMRDARNDEAGAKEFLRSVREVKRSVG